VEPSPDSSARLGQKTHAGGGGGEGAGAALLTLAAHARCVGTHLGRGGEHVTFSRARVGALADFAVKKC